MSVFINLLREQVVALTKQRDVLRRQGRHLVDVGNRLVVSANIARLNDMLRQLRKLIRRNTAPPTKKELRRLNAKPRRCKVLPFPECREVRTGYIT